MLKIYVSCKDSGHCTLSYKIMLLLEKYDLVNYTVCYTSHFDKSITGLFIEIKECSKDYDIMRDGEPTHRFEVILELVWRGKPQRVLFRRSGIVDDIVNWTTTNDIRCDFPEQLFAKAVRDGRRIQVEGGGRRGEGCLSFLRM